MSRVYVATTMADLAKHLAAGRVPAGTDRVVAPDSEEETEYAALMTAADLSADLQPAGAPRVVLAAEVGGDPDGEIRWRDVVAVHADPGPRAVSADPDDDLAWYAPQEVPGLLG